MWSAEMYAKHTAGYSRNMFFFIYPRRSRWFALISNVYGFSDKYINEIAFENKRHSFQLFSPEIFSPEIWDLHTLSDWGPFCNQLKTRNCKLIIIIAKSVKYFIFCEHLLAPWKTFPLNQFRSWKRWKLHFRESIFKNCPGRDVPWPPRFTHASGTQTSR